MSRSNTKTIAKNTGWYGLESFIDAILTISSSIAVARTLGPQRMSYVIYLILIATVFSDLGGLGIPATTRKYMAEFLGMGDRGTARFVYFRSLIVQAGLATVGCIGLTLWVLHDAAPDYRIASLLIAFSIWPAMVNAVSAQANVATEELSKNVPASAIGLVVYFLVILSTVLFHWGVIGVCAAFFLMRFVDFVVRFVPTIRRVLSWETEHREPPDLRKRMFKFAWQSVALMLLQMIVWQRSEMFLLKYLCTDVRQISYYSVAFSMAERLLIAASIFGVATDTTVFVQFGRDKSKIPAITASTFRYLALVSIPLHFIAAALAAPALYVLYGKQYVGAFAVVTIAPLLCLPKAFIAPPTSLLLSHERQKFIILSTVIAGIVDIGIAWWLIPYYGAVGACIGSGAAEVTAVGLIWIICINVFKIRLPWLFLIKVLTASACAALSGYYIAIKLPAILGILLGGCAALAVLFILFYLLRIIEPQDSNRLMVISNMLPGPARSLTSPLLTVLARSTTPPLSAIENSPGQER